MPDPQERRSSVRISRIRACPYQFRNLFDKGRVELQFWRNAAIDAPSATSTAKLRSECTVTGRRRESHHAGGGLLDTSDSTWSGCLLCRGQVSVHTALPLEALGASVPLTQVLATLRRLAKPSSINLLIPTTIPVENVICAL